MRTYVRIRLDRLRANYRSVVEACPAGTEVVAVLKADAYGHGATRAARALAGAGCRRFAVASLEEGAALREAGLEEQILVLSGFLPGQESALVERELIPFIYNERQLACWRGEAARRRRRLPYHLELDTGMTRLGVKLDAAWVRSLAAAREELELVGVGTHLASAEAFDDPLTERQLERFTLWRGRLAAAGLVPRWVHFANSAAIAYRPIGDANLVRAGLALYGYVNRGRGPAPESRLELSPALEWRAAVLDVRDVGRGDRIGYDGAFTADRPMRVAVLGVGYGDGYRRELTGGDVLLGGARRRIVGRISMDLTVVDLGTGPAVAAGDEAVLLGDGLDAAELAERCGTIPYEILCGVGARVARRYEDGD